MQNLRQIQLMKKNKYSPSFHSLTLASLVLTMSCALSANASAQTWDAFEDFYFDSIDYAHNGGASWAGATSPSATGEAWGYYMANCNYHDGFPAKIGSYFPPGTSVASGQVLYAMANYQPLGRGQGQIAGGVAGSADAFDVTGGIGFARYVETTLDNTPGTIGAYGGAWFSAAPGWGTAKASDTGLYLQAAWLGGDSSQGEGICPVITWTAPKSGTFNFTGSFLIGNNGTSGADGAKCSIAIVDSQDESLLPRKVVDQGSYNPFTFEKTFNAGDIVQFQVGTDYQPGAAVGFNATVTLLP